MKAAFASIVTAAFLLSKSGAAEDDLMRQLLAAAAQEPWAVSGPFDPKMGNSGVTMQASHYIGSCQAPAGQLFIAQFDCAYNYHYGRDPVIRSRPITYVGFFDSRKRLRTCWPFELAVGFQLAGARLFKGDHLVLDFSALPRGSWMKIDDEVYAVPGRMLTREHHFERWDHRLGT